MKRAFNSLSLYKKILLILSVTLVCSCFAFLGGIHLLSEKYEKELYAANAQSLDYVSSYVSAKLLAIESVSNNILADRVIQENLTAMKVESKKGRNAPRRRDIYEALYPYTFYENYIRSIVIALPDASIICMGNTSDIECFNQAAMARAARKNQGRIVWKQPKQPGSFIAAARELRQLKYMTLDHLAYVYLVVDLESLVEEAFVNAGYQAQDAARFLVFSEDSRFYPEQGYHDEVARNVIEKVDLANGENVYSIASFDGKKSFILGGILPETGWSYLYFRDYDELFSSIQRTRIHVMLFLAAFALIALVLSGTVIQRIMRHLELLVEKIRRFGQGLPAPEDVRNYDYSDRGDEIGQLHRSFDEMTQSVKVLRDKNYEKQLLLRDTTIKMLQQQINPHFLYNTLDTINWMAQRYGADDISSMARALGNLFRAAITGQDDLIPLSEELKVLDNYIKIQQIRFRDRLAFELHTPEDISKIQVPKLCIQPLVENALKYAMEYSDEVCTIRVSVLDEGEDWKILVANTGSQFEDHLIEKIQNHEITPQGSGVGLVNIHSRLKLIFGDRYGLNIYNKDGMAVVMLTIPKEREVQNAPIDDRG